VAVICKIYTEEVAGILRRGGVGILLTDTIYGIVALADEHAAVQRIYELKQRTPSKPPISLIGDINQLRDTYDEPTLAAVRLLWPGKNTVILPTNTAPEWLTRGTNSISYRLPAKEELRRLILATGPLVAPSANPEGQEPAVTIEEARAYFGDAVDFYIDEGRVTDNTPSKLFRLKGVGFERLR
jgi:L-threonylcarbamoyladenylate synthase